MQLMSFIDISGCVQVRMIAIAPRSDRFHPALVKLGIKTTQYNISLLTHICRKPFSFHCCRVVPCFLLAAWYLLGSCSLSPCFIWNPENNSVICSGSGLQKYSCPLCPMGLFINSDSVKLLPSNVEKAYTFLLPHFRSQLFLCNSLSKSNFQFFPYIKI